MQRPVDAPDQVWSDLKQACAWLGLTEGEFRGFQKKHPERLPHTKIGRGHHFHWRTLVAFSWFLESLSDQGDLDE